jgi:outer membrane protein TolC
MQNMVRSMGSPIRWLALGWLGMCHALTAQAADQIMSLSLEQCLQIARQQSPTVLAAQESYADTYWQYRAFQASFYPQLTLSGSVPSYNQSLSSVIQDDGSTKIREQGNFSNSLSVGISQLIPLTGGTFRLSTDLQRVNEFQPVENAFWSATPVSLSYRQPFFTVNAMRWNREMEPLRYQLAEKRHLEALEDINIAITGGYFSAYIAQIDKEIAEINVTVNDTIFTVSQKRYEVGKIAENELLESEYQLMTAENALSRANLNLERALRNLKISLGLPLDRQIVLEAPHDYPQTRVDPEFALEQASDNASFLLDNRLQLLQAERDVYETKAEQRLSATMSTGLGYDHSSDRFADLYQSLSNQGRFSISFEFPLFQAGQGKDQIKAALARQREVEINSRLDEQQFEQNVFYQVKEFEQSYVHLQMAAKADTIAARRFEVTKNRYLIGKVDITDFFRAQTDKDQARRSYLQAMQNYWVSYYNLRRLTLYDFENDEKLAFTPIRGF